MSEAGRDSPEVGEDDVLVLISGDIRDEFQYGLQHRRQHLLRPHLLLQRRPHMQEPQLLQGGRKEGSETAKRGTSQERTKTQKNEKKKGKIM